MVTTTPGTGKRMPVTSATTPGSSLRASHGLGWAVRASRGLQFYTSLDRDTMETLLGVTAVRPVKRRRCRSVLATHHVLDLVDFALSKRPGATACFRKRTSPGTCYWCTSAILTGQAYVYVADHEEGKYSASCSLCTECWDMLFLRFKAKVSA